MLSAPQLEDAIAAAGKKSPRGVIVDLGAVDFLASAGMGVLVAARDGYPRPCSWALSPTGLRQAGHSSWSESPKSSGCTPRSTKHLPH